MDREWHPSKRTVEQKDAPSRTGIYVVGAVIALFLVILFVRSISGDEEPSSDLVDLETQLEQREQQIASLTAERDAAKAQLNTPTEPTTNQSAAELDRLLAICSRDVNNIRTALSTCMDEVDDFDSVVEDAGRRLCCIARVSDSGINGYDIRGGRIVCVSSGGTSISC